MGLSRKRAEGGNSGSMKKKQKNFGRSGNGGRGRSAPSEEEESYANEYRPRNSYEGRGADGDGQGLGRKRLDPETKSYFLEIAALVRSGGEGNGEEEEGSDELENICANALEETNGKELQLACDPACGRVLETLLLSCDVRHNVEFLLRCSLIAVSMAVDPSGSHIMETALKSVARALLDESSRHADWYSSLEAALTTICEGFGSQAVDVMCNTYGSHVFRCVLSLLSGESADILSQARTGTKPTRSLANKLGGFKSREAMRPKGITFPKLLKVLVGKILETSKENMAQMRTDVSAGPVLQALLKALQGDQEAITQAIAMMLDCEVESHPKEGFVLEHAPIEDIIIAMEDRSSSHLMEVIIQSAPNPLYVEILQRLFRKRLLHLSVHPSANFVVQVLISCARHEGQINLIFEELEENFADLVFQKRSGVIAALLAACGRFHTRQREACRALAAAINSNRASPVELVPRLLHLESAKEDGTFPADLETLSDTRMSVIGSVILQTILSFPKECSQQFCSSIAAMDVVNLLHAVRDPSGSRVLEAFLESSAAPAKHKHRIISKFEGRFAELALHPISCFTVEKSFSAADIKLKEKIAAELVPVQADLIKSRHGAHISRRCDIIGYTKKPEQWRTKESTKQSTHKAFRELFSPSLDQAKENEDSKVDASNDMEAVPKLSQNFESSGGINSKKPKLLQENLHLEGAMAELGFSLVGQKALASANVKKGLKSHEAIVPLDTLESPRDDITDAGNGSEVVKTGKKARKQSGVDDIDRLFDTNRKRDSKKRKHSTEEKGDKSVQSNSITVQEGKSVDPSLKTVMGALEAISKKHKKEKKKK